MKGGKSAPFMHKDATAYPLTDDVTQCMCAFVSTACSLCNVARLSLSCQAPLLASLGGWVMILSSQLFAHDCPHSISVPINVERQIRVEDEGGGWLDVLSAALDGSQ